MTEYSRAATWEDLKKVVRYLDEARVEYALVGGYALGVHGYRRQTEDIDLLVNPSVENSRRWIAALSRLPDGAAAGLAQEQDVFATDSRYAIRINDEITIDVMPTIAGHSWQDMQQHVVEADLDGITVRLLDLPGLLKTKRGVRPKDQQDALVIERFLDHLKSSDSGS